MKPGQNLGRYGRIRVDHVPSLYLMIVMTTLKTTRGGSVPRYEYLRERLVI